MSQYNQNEGAYGIVANVVGVDKIAKMGCLSYLVGGTGGEGWCKFEWVVRSRSGRFIIKWMPTKRMGNFRVKWIPEHIKKLNHGFIYISGTQEEMASVAAELNVFAEELRKES